MSNKIPKIVHYCWFGGKEKPTIVKKCIESWKVYLSDYVIKEWNEDNFDIDSNEFVKQAYKEGKFAFVSDFVRVMALYNYGGIYLDTDVEVFRSFNDLLSNYSFWGFEEKDYIATSTIGACKGNELIGQFFKSYDGKLYLTKSGNMNTMTNVFEITKIMNGLGIQMDGTYQELEGIATIYPQEYFSPYDYINCYNKATENTYAVHYFYKSWLPFRERVKSNIKKVVARLIGGKNIAKFRNVIKK